MNQLLHSGVALGGGGGGGGGGHSYMVCHRNFYPERNGPTSFPGRQN